MNALYHSLFVEGPWFGLGDGRGGAATPRAASYSKRRLVKRKTSIATCPAACLASAAITRSLQNSVADRTINAVLQNARAAFLRLRHENNCTAGAIKFATVRAMCDYLSMEAKPMHDHIYLNDHIHLQLENALCEAMPREMAQEISRLIGELIQSAIAEARS